MHNKLLDCIWMIKNKLNTEVINNGALRKKLINVATQEL